jgi:NAD-dependent SIR2 family protein deacetylase
MNSAETFSGACEQGRASAALIRSSRSLTAFQCVPRMLGLDYFFAHPDKAWPVIEDIFYDNFGSARPNKAHEVPAAWETKGILKTLITPNIDSAQ